MSQPRKISQKINNILCFFIMILLFGSDVHADAYDDEESVFYDTTVDEDFRIFFKKYHRYPRSWIELGVKTSCFWGKHALPKRDEGLIWRPNQCELSYQLVYSNQTAFKVAALKNGHVVSIFENYKATYFKTPYHRHETVCPEHVAC